MFDRTELDPAGRGDGARFMKKNSPQRRWVTFHDHRAVLEMWQQH